MELDTKLVRRLILIIATLIDTVVYSHPIVNGKAAKSSMKMGILLSQYEVRLNVNFIPDQFPFAVVFAIHDEKSPKTFKVFCGGTIVEMNLNISWAISAAHCFLNSNM
jgi:hypothetical protein